MIAYPSPTDTSRHATYVRAALEVLDEFGPAVQSLGMTAADLSRLSGMHRSAVYRYWETIQELNDDLAVLLATGADAWQCRLASSDPRRPLEESLAHALADPLLEATVYVRGLAAGWSPEHPVRAAIRSWDEARLRELAIWLEAHLAAAGRALVGSIGHRLIAATITAMVTGNVTVNLVTAADEEEQATIATPQLAPRIAAIVDQLTVPAPRELRPVPRRTTTRRQRRFEVLAKVVEHHPPRAYLPYGRPTTVRLVHLGRLARRLGVHERRLYAMWPTATEMGVDLSLAVIARERRRIGDVLGELLERGASDSITSFEELLSSCCQSAVRAPMEGGANHFSVTYALSDPVVRAQVAEPIDAWMRELRMALLAGQALARSARRPEVSGEEYAACIREAALGVQLMAALRREMLDEKVVVRGEEHPLAGLILMLVASSMSDQLPDAGTAPPVAERSDASSA